MTYRRKTLRHLHRDEDGSVIIWSTLVIMIIIALIGLGVDGARILNLNSNLQEIADGAALAGAQQLDGSGDAITRATNAAVTLLQSDATQPVSGNILKWSDVSKSGYVIVDSGADAPKFFTSEGVATTDPKVAARIKVTTVVRNVSPTFSMISHVASLSTSATATAQVSYSVCAPLQSFICNPWEDQEAVKGSASNWTTNILPGQMVKLTNGTGGAPGNWGFIAPPNVNGNPWNQVPYWSQLRPSSCQVVSPSQVVNAVDTGNNGSKAVTGMNVRFDNPDSKAASSLAAPIVIDGLKSTTNANAAKCANDTPASATQTTLLQTDQPGSNYVSLCGANTPTVSCPLPRDRDLANLGGNAWQTSYKGTGMNNADLVAYWKNHHGGANIPKFYDATQAKYVDTNTRWQVFQMESDTTTYPDAAFTAASEALEPSKPFCSASNPNAGIKRRLVNVAVVDCDYWGIKGGSNDLPVTTLMAEFFMTEPADANGGIYGELVKTYVINGSGSNGSGSNLYRMVELVN